MFGRDIEVYLIIFVFFEEMHFTAEATAVARLFENFSFHLSTRGGAVRKQERYTWSWLVPPGYFGLHNIKQSSRRSCETYFVFSFPSFFLFLKDTNIGVSEKRKCSRKISDQTYFRMQIDISICIANSYWLWWKKKCANFWICLSFVSGRKIKLRWFAHYLHTRTHVL